MHEDGAQETTVEARGRKHVPGAMCHVPFATAAPDDRACAIACAIARLRAHILLKHCTSLTRIMRVPNFFSCLASCFAWSAMLSHSEKALAMPLLIIRLTNLRIAYRSSSASIHRFQALETALLAKRPIVPLRYAFISATAIHCRHADEQGCAARRSRFFCRCSSRHSAVHLLRAAETPLLR